MTLVEVTRDGSLLDLSKVLGDSVVVSFFVPCFNEEKHIGGTIEKLIAVSGELKLNYEILVFDDASRDCTVDVVRAYQQKFRDVRLRLFVNETNRGVARNFIEGAFQGEGTYYRLVCGDDVEPIETLRAILQQAGKADIIIPYHTEVVGRPLYRRMISRLYTHLVNFASGRNLRYYNGLPLFRRRDVTRFHVEATGSGYQAEFLLRLLQEGRSYVEIPLIASDREGSLSLNLRNFVSVAFSIFKIIVARVRGYLTRRRERANYTREGL
jgi:glycosyltransferase involved in cell wall biosynthesis